MSVVDVGNGPGSRMRRHRRLSRRARLLVAVLARLGKQNSYAIKRNQARALLFLKLAELLSTESTRKKQQLTINFTTKKAYMFVFTV